MQTETPVVMDRLHFLVHPGFAPLFGDTAIREKDRKLADRYVEYAQSFTRTEIMMVFTPLSEHSLRSHSDNKAGEFCLSIIQNLRETLSDRLIVLNGLSITVQDTKRTHAELQKGVSMMEENGMRLSSDVQSEAYGESMALCVPWLASTANEHLDLPDLTLLRPELTNWAFSRTSMRQLLEENTRHIQMEHPFVLMDYHRWPQALKIGRAAR